MHLSIALLLFACFSVLVPTHTLAQCVDADSDGFFNTAGCGTLVDCADGDPSVHPGATEIAGNSIDEDCDGGDSCYRDLDLDGYGTEVLVASADFDCTDSGESLLSSDCHDSNPLVHPGAFDIPGNTIDEDCDGMDELPVALDVPSWGTLKQRF